MAIIDDPSAVYQTVLWDGNNTNRTITFGGNADLQANLIWAKKRDSGDHNQLYDSVRGFGAAKDICSGQVFPQGAAANGSTALGFISSTTSDGFVLTNGNHGSVPSLLLNYSGNEFVARGFKETAGVFDIVTYEGSGSAKTVAHNLGVKPTCIWVKNIDSTDPQFNWRCFHASIGATRSLKPNGTEAADTDAGYWNDTEPTSSVFSVKDSGETNNGSQTYIAYLWADSSMSKCGSFEGNGNADGAFVNLPFRPAFLMTKSVDSTSSWHMYDNKRQGFNVDNDSLVAETTTVEATTDMVDLLANGFKCRIATDPNVAETFIYVALAEHPLVSSTDNGSIPGVAR